MNYLINDIIVAASEINKDINNTFIFDDIGISFEQTRKKMH